MMRAVTFTYKNHRGEVAKRNVVPIALRYMTTEWHSERQWLLEAYDNDREAVRYFVMRDITNWAPAR